MHVHHMDTPKRVALLLLAAFEILIGAAFLLQLFRLASSGASASVGRLILHGFLGMAAIATGAGNAYLASYVRIVTSPEGIQYYNIGLVVTAHWNDTVAIERARLGLSRIEKLALRQASIQLSSWRPDWTIRYMKDAVVLDPFRRAWKHGQLGQDIKLYAPHLFE